MNALLDRMMAKRPDDRFRDYGDLIAMWSGCPRRSSRPAGFLVRCVALFIDLLFVGLLTLPFEALLSLDGSVFLLILGPLTTSSRTPAGALHRQGGARPRGRPVGTLRPHRLEDFPRPIRLPVGPHDNLSPARRTSSSRSWCGATRSPQSLRPFRCCSESDPFSTRPSAPGGMRGRAPGEVPTVTQPRSPGWTCATLVLVLLAAVGVGVWSGFRGVGFVPSLNEHAPLLGRSRCAPVRRRGGSHARS